MPFDSPGPTTHIHTRDRVQGLSCIKELNGVVIATLEVSAIFIEIYAL